MPAEQLAIRPDLEKIAVTPLPPELVKAQEKALKEARDLVIETDEDYQFSFVMRQGYATNIRVVGGLLDPNVAELNAAHKRSTAHRSSAVSPFQEADRIVMNKRLEFDAKQEQLAREKEDRERRLLVETRQTDALASAAELEAVGDKEGAAAVVQAAIEAPAPAVVVQPNIPKQKGAVKTETYDFRIVDEDKVPRNYLEPNMVAIRAAVKTQGKKANIPGVEVFPKKGESVRL